MFLLLCSILIFSCQKDDRLNLENTEQNTGKIDFPSLVDDRYSFRDFDHLSKYYKVLDQMYTEDDQKFNDFIRTTNEIESVHKLLETDIFTTPEERYQPFLTDPIMMTIVNKHFEFQVETYLVTYMNNNELLLGDSKNLKLKSEIRAMPKGEKINLRAIPEDAILTEDTNQAAFAAVCGCSISIVKASCSQVRVFGECKNLTGGPGNGTVTIELGDFAPNTETHEVYGNFDFLFPLTDATGFEISATANPDCIFGNTQFANFSDDGGDACDNLDKDTGWLWSQDGVQGLSHRTAAYTNFWSHYEEAKAYSKFWNGSDWKQNDADLEVTINADRKIVTDCSSLGSEDETQTCHCKNKRARVNTGTQGFKFLVGHCDGDVEGTFKKTINTNSPINGSGIVDFDCCE